MLVSNVGEAGEEQHGRHSKHAMKVLLICVNNKTGVCDFSGGKARGMRVSAGLSRVKPCVFAGLSPVKPCVLAGLSRVKPRAFCRLKSS